MEKKTSAKTRKVPGQISVRMKIDDKNEWNFNAGSACEAIEEGQRICRDNGLRWEDVQVWDFA